MTACVVLAAAADVIREKGEELGVGEQGSFKVSSVCILFEWQKLEVQGRGGGQLAA